MVENRQTNARKGLVKNEPRHRNKHLQSDRQQVNDNGLVVWRDPDGVYALLVGADLPDTEVLRHKGSFVQLRWEIDQKLHGWRGHMVVYVPMAQ